MSRTCCPHLLPAGIEAGGPALRWRLIERAALCSLTLIVAGLASAADLEIDPVRVELSSEQKTAAITVRNTSDRPASVQVEVAAWAQVDGHDVYTESRELLVSPPLATIPARDRQIIRAALRRPADATNELSYRINVRQLPGAPIPESSGVQGALRIGVPAFVQPQSGRPIPKMVWRVERIPGDGIKVVLRNEGTAHVQVTDFALYTPGGLQAIAGEIRSTYVLAGQTREWLIMPSSFRPIADARLQLKAYTDVGEIDTELVLERY